MTTAPTSATLRDLLERVERATAPDRYLDWLLAETFGEIPKHSVREVGWDYDWYRAPGEFTLWKALDAEGRSVTHWSPEKRTASIDSALALVEKANPGAWIELNGPRKYLNIPSPVPNVWKAEVTTEWTAMTPPYGWGPTAPLAILAALLKALLAKSEAAR